MLPIETVRNRLQVQRNPAVVTCSKDNESVVGLSPVRYSGPWDCVCRILRQEGSKSIRIRGLYRGFKIRFFSNLFVAVLKLMVIPE